eukprot:4871133-Pyramimonas_sp.AAC.1
MATRGVLQVACYPGGGAHYGRHIDNVDGDGRGDGRKLTMILYLNSDWSGADGGELRIHEA